jgi:hypothetical protein
MSAHGQFQLSIDIRPNIRPQPPHSGGVSDGQAQRFSSARPNEKALVLLAGAAVVVAVVAVVVIAAVAMKLFKTGDTDQSASGAGQSDIGRVFWNTR